MFRIVLKYGVIAGLIVGAALVGVSLAYDGQPPRDWGMAAGFASMLVALSAVFVGIKRHRDSAGGGVIRFWPAFGLGLAISLVASVIYVAAWELSLVLIDTDFAAMFAAQMIERAEAKGLAGDALAEAVRKAREFEAMYRNPLLRMPMTFVEIFPVGMLVSLVSALVLRNPRVLPAR
ncbi:DUF4199 domain-containing protein [Luteimonas sp. SJ-92]|uniref:DUF4199 domain-containing protein n=1 Tax=Luteimonas salinisoli TaxID=2752307 RepID=A0A853JCZ2_9GAMM|nr:DUF4199 domain-containing protein [Luteimonas salinisoli]NZA27156.1 DUF4199 domain-containing protein [Luteimonas salinisoli]